MLDTREARGKLQARGKPYWRAIERGLHLGYRRLKGRAGTWWARHYLGDQNYSTEALGIADDMSDADGIAVLSYWQAQDQARARMVARAHAAVGKTGPYTVADAFADYVRYLESDGRPTKSILDTTSRANAHILAALGKTKVADLTAKRLREWRDSVARSKARARSRKDATKPNYRGTVDIRARRASANRTWTILRAALNHAFREGNVGSDLAWRSVKPFRNVESARLRYLTIHEAKRLINACDYDFRPMVEAALQTGARYSEIARLQVHDFNPDAGTLAIRQSKSGKPRHVVLTDEGTTLFRQLTVGKSGNELIFCNRGRIERALKRERERLKKAGKLPDAATVKDLGDWRTSEQSRPMVEACKHAKISPPISFHGLRHTWASLAVMNGVPLMVVAKNLGHADTRMVEKHYGHLAPSYIADAIRAGAPKFGTVETTNVVEI